MSILHLQGGRVIDPASRRDETSDLWIVDGRVSHSRPADRQVDETLNVSGCIVAPGLIDCRVFLGEPGFEEDETIASGSAAAVAGGLTAVGAMPETDPVVDTRAFAEFVSRQAERAGNCRVYPLGAVTKNAKGEELAEIAQLTEGAAVAFTDGHRPIANAEVMRRALQYTGMGGRAIISHPQVPELVHGGVMHEGYYSTVLGLRGMPPAAEEIMVRRNIALAESTGGRMHLMSLSTKNSVEEVRHAQKRGVKVTADVTPYHLLLTDECLESFDPNYKLEPPLRSREHIDALIAGLKDGTIGVLTSDHRPYSDEKKMVEIDKAPFGIVGLETLIPLCIEALVEPGHLSWSQFLEKLTVGPAALLKVPGGTLAEGAPGDVTVIDPNVAWTIDAGQFRSQSRNTPFDGRAVRGRAKFTIVEGRVAFRG
ncbi:Dihydroorotase [Caulifigura coniformis]|uniref:Dihydroorotase n=1 Tax=Caulifigura coniformis TaxID=2527983 RepID=A0A517SDV3_9PLAN|nr:dihydroorotase [Caulifigura coniformis]QDT54304.1 Dihydroorotase [Caulifigura coniformis]